MKVTRLSGILTQAVDDPNDLRPIAYTSASFFLYNTQQRWSATGKEAFAVYQSILKFNLNLRGAQCILHCDHKPLKLFVSCGMKIPKLNCGSMEFIDYHLTVIHIKDSNNILADAISRLKTLGIYRDLLDYPKIFDTMTSILEIVVLSIDKLCTEQKDIQCRN